MEEDEIRKAFSLRPIHNEDSSALPAFAVPAKKSPDDIKIPVLIKKRKAGGGELVERRMDSTSSKTKQAVIEHSAHSSRDHEVDPLPKAISTDDNKKDFIHLSQAGSISSSSPSANIGKNIEKQSGALSALGMYSDDDGSDSEK